MLKQDDDGNGDDDNRRQQQEGLDQMPGQRQYRATELSTNYISAQSASTVGGIDKITTTHGLGQYDIICGRNKLAFNNIGNRRFRVTVAISLDRYMIAATRKETSNVIKSVADIVRGNGGRFLKLSPDDSWDDLDEKHVHEKVGHALRDAAALRKESDGSRRYHCIPSPTIIHRASNSSEENVALEPGVNSSSLSGKAFESTFSSPSIQFPEHDRSRASLPDISEQEGHDRKILSKDTKNNSGKLDRLVAAAFSSPNRRQLPSTDVELKAFDLSSEQHSLTERDGDESANIASLYHEALEWMSDESDTALQYACSGS
jgi:hypothetical protein